MKTYLLNIIPRIRKYSKRLEDLTTLTSKHWLLIQENEVKTVYIFQKYSKRLLISNNGIVKKATWELIDNDKILIEIDETTFLFNHGFADDKVIALNLDGTQEYAILVDEESKNRFRNLQSVATFLKNKYGNKHPPGLIRQPQNISIVPKPSHTSNNPDKHWPKIEDAKYTFESADHESRFKPYKQNGKWGYIDSNSNVVIDFIYEDARPFSEGLAMVQKDNLKGFIDRDGNLIIDYQFDEATFFKNGLAKVNHQSRSFSIDKYGNEVDQ